MVKTTIINETPGKLSLKEGNAGVYRDLGTIDKNGTHIIEVDPNATYREYVVVSTPSESKVFISSDDCLDNSKITISFDGKQYKTNNTPRDDSKETASGNFFSKMLSKVFPSKK